MMKELDMGFLVLTHSPITALQELSNRPEKWCRKSHSRANMDKECDRGSLIGGRGRKEEWN